MQRYRMKICESGRDRGPPLSRGHAGATLASARAGAKGAPPLSVPVNDRRYHRTARVSLLIAGQVGKQSDNGHFNSTPKEITAYAFPVNELPRLLHGAIIGCRSSMRTVSEFNLRVVLEETQLILKV